MEAKIIQAFKNAKVDECEFGSCTSVWIITNEMTNKLVVFARQKDAEREAKPNDDVYPIPLWLD